MGIIEVSDVTRTYGSGRERFTAVDGVSFEVAAGELVSILGVNGAGKTSLVEVVEGIAPATSGRVRVLGHDAIRSRALVRPRTGIMLQEAGFAQDLTVAETLGMWAGTLSRPRGVAEAMELTDLSHRADVRVKSLSGGERRRLDLAMATMGHPDVLFLDEPTTGLDPASRQRTWELVRSMLDHGTSILLTTHYLEEAEELADRVLIMAAGRVVTGGTVAQVVASQPATISFATTSSPTESQLATLAGVRGAPRRTRGRTEVHSDDLQMTLSALLELCARENVRLENLDARSASLEQAFLALNAEHGRDATTGNGALLGADGREVEGADASSAA